jgi:hypothetical protein
LEILLALRVGKPRPELVAESILKINKAIDDHIVSVDNKFKTLKGTMFSTHDSNCFMTIDDRRQQESTQSTIKGQNLQRSLFFQEKAKKYVNFKIKGRSTTRKKRL